MGVEPLNFKRVTHIDGQIQWKIIFRLTNSLSSSLQSYESGSPPESSNILKPECG